MSGLEELFEASRQTNVTKTTHRKLYPGLSPSNPELSQAGRAVLVSGGGTGVGFAIARAFVQASADTVVIIGRRADVLAAAGVRLEQVAKSAKTSTKIIARTCDIVN